MSQIWAPRSRKLPPASGASSHNFVSWYQVHNDVSCDMRTVPMRPSSISFFALEEHAAVPQRLDDAERHARVVAGSDHRVAVGDVRGHRLLHEHVLAPVRRRDHLLGVRLVRRRHYHRVDVRSGQQRLQRRLDVHPVVLREAGRPAPAVDGDEPAALVVLGDALGVGPAHVARADHPDSYGVQSCPPVVTNPRPRAHREYRPTAGCRVACCGALGVT